MELAAASGMCPSAEQVMELRREDIKVDRGWQMISVIGKDW